MYVSYDMELGMIEIKVSLEISLQAICVYGSVIIWAYKTFAPPPPQSKTKIEQFKKILNRLRQKNN